MVQPFGQFLLELAAGVTLPVAAFFLKQERRRQLTFVAAVVAVVLVGIYAVPELSRKQLGVAGLAGHEVQDAGRS